MKMKNIAALIATLAFATLLNADTGPNAKDEWGRTLLHRAVEGSDTEAVAELLAASAAQHYWMSSGICPSPTTADSCCSI